MQHFPPAHHPQTLRFCCLHHVPKPSDAAWICPAHPARTLSCPAAGPFVCCRTVTGNELSGSVPASWTQLASLEKITMQPGNPGMCTGLPPDAAFKLCKAGDQLCLDQPVSNSTNCLAPPPPAPAISGFPVVAVAVPVSVVAVAAIVAAGLLWRRQRRRARAAITPTAGQQTAFYKASSVRALGCCCCSSVQQLTYRGAVECV